MSNAQKGSNHPNWNKTIVNKENVNLIRKDYKNGMKCKDVMKKYNIGRSTFYNIINCKNAYKNL